MNTDNRILFFDGECSLCNRFVDRLVRADRRGVLRIASLQGETGKRLLPPLPADPAQWSIVLLDEDGTHERSEAVLRAYGHMGGWRSLASWLRVIPRALRDGIYRFVARRRYRWFGRRDTCRIPTPEERARFLP